MDKGLRGRKGVLRCPNMGIRSLWTALNGFVILFQKMPDLLTYLMIVQNYFKEFEV